MQIAVIQTGGKQYVVAKGMKLRVEKLPGNVGGNIHFPHTLLVSDEKGSDAKIGTPHVTGAKVSAKILSQERAQKISVVKYKNKIRYVRRVGHRQPFTKVEITSIA